MIWNFLGAIHSRFFDFGYHILGVLGAKLKGFAFSICFIRGCSFKLERKEVKMKFLNEPDTSDYTPNLKLLTVRFDCSSFIQYFLSHFLAESAEHPSDVRCAQWQPGANFIVFFFAPKRGKICWCVCTLVIFQISPVFARKSGFEHLTRLERACRTYFALSIRAKEKRNYKLTLIIGFHVLRCEANRKFRWVG